MEERGFERVRLPSLASYFSRVFEMLGLGVGRLVSPYRRVQSRGAWAVALYIILPLRTPGNKPAQILERPPYHPPALCRHFPRRTPNPWAEPFGKRAIPTTQQPWPRKSLSRA